MVKKSKSMQNAHLEQWSVVMPELPDDKYKHPELREMLRGKCLQGVVSGHPRIPDGSEITTSSLKEIDVKDKKAVTRNTIYTLGEPSPVFIHWLKKQGKDLEDFE